MFLEKIADTKAKEIRALHEQISSHDRKRAKRLPQGLSLKKKLSGTEAAIIAEVKSASPSKGVISEKLDPVKVAKGYELGGAAAVSVLTDTVYFHGKPEYLTQVKQNVGLPVLRKDFIMDELQVYESKLLGADIILLIAALLDEERLKRFTCTAHELGMEVLVEIHEEDEIPSALSCDPDVIGINNRNLHTFQTDISHTEKLRPLIPPGRPVIGESGVLSLEDAKRMHKAGVQGLLVGEYLMRQEDPERAVRELREGLRR
ncbi:indole-3-glycerol phosphate synthase TrpC [Thermoactinomyces sp. CICC 23799]|uniref:indole-3-glycerol phosphate synthase TrpC n=1 Tax=Thermoactinomyces sp. CICC 23799 TaxID=2767429 RepID=UPI0018DD7EAB|nr:indole-3-glycerol phosphate synthase TrpC [Thermoactinomyces sp. CICC 23799]MBH8601291.1 indole-3-glycerol phosphate synthase TrpC [Thermoactinomyces sp. CICC 23799]